MRTILFDMMIESDREFVHSEILQWYFTQYPNGHSTQLLSMAGLHAIQCEEMDVAFRLFEMGTIHSLAFKNVDAALTYVETPPANASTLLYVVSHSCTLLSLFADDVTADGCFGMIFAASSPGFLPLSRASPCSTTLGALLSAQPLGFVRRNSTCC